MIAVKNAKVVLEYGIIFDGVLLIDGDRIANVGRASDISIPDDSFWCYLSKRDAITKISFATEEMHKLTMRS